MADRTGQILGHYRIVRLLGWGGFAEVYLGEHLRLKTQAAIKVLHTALDEDDIKGFIREAQTVARLKHPHIVRVFDFDVQDHTPFLVMDYLPNGSVRRIYPKGVPLPLGTIVSYVKQVASALQYAHDQKLIHRDVKPENMLFDQDNCIVLSDFGIALIVQSSRSQSTKQVAGTASYMAPEQFQGHPHRASDQYALGVVVYEWLSGDRPFHGTFSEIASQHLFVTPPPLHQKIQTIPLDVEQVVLTALAKNSQERYPNVQAFATAFELACETAITHPVTHKLKKSPSDESTFSANNATTIPPKQSLLPTVEAMPFRTLKATGTKSKGKTDEKNRTANSGKTGEAPVSSKPANPTTAPSQHQRKRRLSLWIALALVTLSLLGGAVVGAFIYMTRSTSTSTPQETLDRYCGALQSGDYQTAYNQLSPSIQSSETESEFAHTLQAGGKVSACAYSSVNTTSNRAMTNMTLVTSSGQTSSSIVTLMTDSDNTWKISMLPTTPGMTLTAFCNALQNKDYPTAYTQLSSSIKKVHAEAQFEADFTGLTCSYGTVSQSGRTASTTMTFRNANGQTSKATVTLIQDSDSNSIWKIDNIQF